jgi:hypothetical protein
MPWTIATASAFRLTIRSKETSVSSAVAAWVCVLLILGGALITNAETRSRTESAQNEGAVKFFSSRNLSC